MADAPLDVVVGEVPAHSSGCSVGPVEVSTGDTVGATVNNWERVVMAVPLEGHHRAARERPVGYSNETTVLLGVLDVLLTTGSPVVVETGTVPAYRLACMPPRMP